MEQMNIEELYGKATVAQAWSDECRSGLARAVYDRSGALSSWYLVELYLLRDLAVEYAMKSCQRLGSGVGVVLWAGRLPVLVESLADWHSEPGLFCGGRLEIDWVFAFLQASVRDLELADSPNPFLGQLKKRLVELEVLYPWPSLQHEYVGEVLEGLVE